MKGELGAFWWWPLSICWDAAIDAAAAAGPFLLLRGERRGSALDVSASPEIAERGVFEGVRDGVPSSIRA